ncbi:MAG TPA: 2Fe-2S iron-sulfur cluster-binding protein [bacterium]|nr:2Fe-2S iron-sulfur cluster-binding protein [bacterium]
MKKITLEIDGKTVSAEEGATLLETALKAGANIPTLCYHEKLKPSGSCRLCMVEISKGARTRLVASCCYPVEAGLVVRTSTDQIEKIRKTIVELLMPLASSGPIKALAARYGLKTSRFEAKSMDCVLCGLCVRYCAEIKNEHGVYFKGRGVNRRLALLPQQSLLCENCGECFKLCPGGWIVSGAETME